MSERSDDEYAMSAAAPLTPLGDTAIEAFFADPTRAAPDPALARLAADVSAAVSASAPVPDMARLGQFLRPTAAVPTATGSAAGTGPSPWPTNGYRSTRPAAVPSPTVTTARPTTRATGGVVVPFRRRFGMGAAIGGAAALALSGVAVAGTTGHLPGPAQDAFVVVVEAITPFQISPDQAPSPPTSPPTTPPTPTADAGPLTGPHSGGSLPLPAAPTGSLPVAPGAADGLDTARKTPAAPFIPPFAGQPGPGTGGTGDDGGSGTGGLDTARQTPAAGFIPPFAGSAPASADARPFAASAPASADAPPFTGSAPAGSDSPAGTDVPGPAASPGPPGPVGPQAEAGPPAQVGPGAEAGPGPPTSVGPPAQAGPGTSPGAGRPAT